MPLQKELCFDDELVLQQLRYTGMLETVRIRRSGYSAKYTFQVGHPPPLPCGKVSTVDLAFATKSGKIRELTPSWKSHAGALTEHLLAWCFDMSWFICSHLFCVCVCTHTRIIAHFWRSKDL